jgi:cytoskeletal protein CcmA (bactofilin family)
MAGDVTVIGRGAHVRGKVSGPSDLEIHGHVEGDVTIGGEVTVESHGLVAANLSARRLIVRGAVKGDLVAEEAILLEDGARVVGDVRAPRVAITTGALVRGYVQTSAGGENGARVARPATRASDARPSNASNASVPARASTQSAQHASNRAVPSAPRSAPNMASRPSASGRGSDTGSAGRRDRERDERPSRGSLLAGGSFDGGRRGPPPPVVPTLKKGAKGIHKKAPSGAAKR